MAFTGAATVVVAQTFEIVDPTGVIVAIFGQSTLGSNSLLFKHNDVLTTDSFLFWSDPTTLGAGQEEIVLSGPETVGATGAPPQIALAKLTAGKRIRASSTNQLDLATETVAAVANQSLLLDGVANSMYLGELTSFNGVLSIVTGDIQLSTDSTVELFSAAGVTRGKVYGVTFHQASWAGAVNVTVAPVVLATINLPNAPVAGATAVISFSVSCALLLDGTSISVYCDVDTVVQNPVTEFQPGIAVTTAACKAQLAGTVQVSVGTGTHTVRLLANVSATNNSWSARGFGSPGGNSIFNVVYCR